MIAEVVIGKPVRTAAGPVVHALLSFVVVAIFFGWTMRFLLAGRVPWHFVIRPAVVTAVLWFGLSLFSSVYFSSVVISDSRQYGTIGVVFTFLTWFILIGGVIVLGTAGGAVWQQRPDVGSGPIPTNRPNHADEDGDRRRVPCRRAIQLRISSPTTTLRTG